MEVVLNLWRDCCSLRFSTGATFMSTAHNNPMAIKIDTVTIHFSFPQECRWWEIWEGGMSTLCTHRQPLVGYIDKHQFPLRCQWTLKAKSLLQRARYVSHDTLLRSWEPLRSEDNKCLEKHCLYVVISWQCQYNFDCRFCIQYHQGIVIFSIGCPELHQITLKTHSRFNVPWEK